MANWYSNLEYSNRCVPGLTALHIIAVLGDDIMFKYFENTPLINKINFQDKNGNTALHLAVIVGSESIVSALLKSPLVDPNITNKSG